MSGRAYRRILQEREKERMAQKIEAEVNSTNNVQEKDATFSEVPLGSEHEKKALKNAEEELNDEKHLASVPKFNPFELLEDESPNEVTDEDTYEIIDHADHSETEEPIEEKSQVPSHGKEMRWKDKKTTRIRGKSKKTASSLKKKDIDNLSVEDFDRILKNVTFEKTQLPEALSSSSSPFAFLRLEAKNFNPENELIRVFGPHVIQEQHANGHRRRTRPMFRRSLLTTPTDQWPPFEFLGLTMEVTNKPYYVYRHPAKFQYIQRQFLEAVDLLHPDQFLNILAMYPYHPDTLLMLSRISDQSGDRAQARDLLQRAIYTLEKTAMASFSWTQPEQRRLSYDDYENRVLFLALFKNMEYLARDACWRTALEWAKLLWSLEPEQDPLGCLFILDYYALQANAYEWLLQLIASLKNPWAYPNLAFGEVFANYFLGNHDKAAALLLKASTLYPYLCQKLCSRPGVLPSLLLEELYVTRIETSLMRNTELIGWVKATLQSFRCPSVPPYHLLTSYQWDSLYRHTILSDIGHRFMASLPESARQQTQLFDPLPPSTTRSPYTDFHQRRTGIPSNSHPLLGMLTSLLPWNNEVTGPIDESDIPLQALATQMVEQIRGLIHGLVPPRRDPQEADPSSSSSRNDEHRNDEDLEDE